MTFSYKGKEIRVKIVEKSNKQEDVKQPEKESNKPEATKSNTVIEVNF
jgi:hypothetical protein